jgi:hypothetical protein
MVKLAKASKSVAVGAVLATSLLMPVRIASADTSSTLVPNTQVCGAGTVNINNYYTHGGAFAVKWNSDNTFTITVTKALPAEVDMFASSYHLTNPNYAGGCFRYNSVTSPQEWDSNTQVVSLPQDFVGTKTVTVVLPETCYNEQVDLYFGRNIDGVMSPLNGQVGGRGHDAYNWIAGNIMLTANNPACIGGKGGGPTTPPTTPTTPETPVVVTPAAVVTPTLTNTGLNIRLTSVIAAAFIVAAGYVFSRRSKASE